MTVSRRLSRLRLVRDEGPRALLWMRADLQGAPSGHCGVSERGDSCRPEHGMERVACVDTDGRNLCTNLRGWCGSLVDQLTLLVEGVGCPKTTVLLVAASRATCGGVHHWLTRSEVRQIGQRDSARTRYRMRLLGLIAWDRAVARTSRGTERSLACGRRGRGLALLLAPCSSTGLLCPPVEGSPACAEG